jgi:hypothetical protein
MMDKLGGKGGGKNYGTLRQYIVVVGLRNHLTYDLKID